MLISLEKCYFCWSWFAVRNKKKVLTSYVLVCGIETSEDFEWYKIDPGWSSKSFGLINNQFGIIQVVQRSLCSWGANMSKKIAKGSSVNFHT